MHIIPDTQAEELNLSNLLPHSLCSPVCVPAFSSAKLKCDYSAAPSLCRAPDQCFKIPSDECAWLPVLMLLATARWKSLS